MAVVKPQKTDVFPVSLVSFTRDHVLPRHLNFKLASESKRSNIIPFIISLVAKTVYYFPLDLNVASKKHFWDTGKNLDPTKYLTLLDWGYIANRLTLKVTGMKHNHDVRTCFKFQNNFFLVKKCFTFGLRTVKKGTHHLYQMGCVPMAFYLLESRKCTHRHEKMFVPDHQFTYNKMTLQSGENYRIPEGSWYVVCASTYTFFAVHVISSDAVLPFPTHNPVSILGKKQANRSGGSKTPHTASRHDMYKTPLRTPMIESVLQNDLEEEDEGERGSDRQYPSDPGPSSVGAGSNPSTLMPPPPAPPSPQQSSLRIIKEIFLPSIPLTKVINITHPDNLQWYQGMQKPLYHDPKADFKSFDAPDESSAAMDLSLPKVSEGMTVEEVVQAAAPPPAVSTFASLSPQTVQRQLEPSFVDFAPSPPLPSLMTALSPWVTPSTYYATETNSTPTTGAAATTTTAALGLSNATASGQTVVSFQPSPPSPLPCWTAPPPPPPPDAATFTKSVSQQQSRHPQQQQPTAVAATGSLPAQLSPFYSTFHHETSALFSNTAFGNSNPSCSWTPTAPEATRVPSSTAIMFSTEQQQLHLQQQQFQQPADVSSNFFYYFSPVTNVSNACDETLQAFLNSL